MSCIKANLERDVLQQVSTVAPSTSRAQSTNFSAPVNFDALIETRRQLDAQVRALPAVAAQVKAANTILETLLK